MACVTPGCNKKVLRNECSHLMPRSLSAAYYNFMLPKDLHILSSFVCVCVLACWEAIYIYSANIISILATIHSNYWYKNRRYKRLPNDKSISGVAPQHAEPMSSKSQVSPEINNLWYDEIYKCTTIVAFYKHRAAE